MLSQPKKRLKNLLCLCVTPLVLCGCASESQPEPQRTNLASRSLKRPGVLIIDPDGDEVGFIPTGPGNQTDDPQNSQGLPSNVEFGTGEEANVLYVTVDLSLYRIPLGVKGYHPY